MPKYFHHQEFEAPNQQMAVIIGEAISRIISESFVGDPDKWDVSTVDCAGEQDWSAIIPRTLPSWMWPVVLEAKSGTPREMV